MNKPEFIIIAALAESNRAIANKGDLPWNIPQDTQRFEILTRNHTLIVGRQTWAKDLKNSPLENRSIIVVTSLPQEVEIEAQDYPEEVIVVTSVKEAMEAKETEKIFIAGGSTIYAQTLELADTWELTLVEGDFAGDTFFPEYQHLIDGKSPLPFRFGDFVSGQLSVVSSQEMPIPSTDKEQLATDARSGKFELVTKDEHPGFRFETYTKIN